MRNKSFFCSWIVVEEKGIYSIEKFLVARRLMYWQVYLHKTVLGAETLLVNILKRAKELTAKGEKLFATPTLQLFLENNYTKHDFEKNPLKQTSHDKNLDLSHALLQVTNHNRKVFAAKNVTPKEPQTEVEKQRKAALAARKKRELDLLTKHLELQLNKIECEKVCVKADDAIKRLDKFLGEMNQKPHYQP